VSIYEYVAHDSKPYAECLIDKLTRRSEQIAAFPLSGRTVPEYRDESIREVIERPYRIIYRIKADQIDILAVVHGAQEL
jgi:toxin ParE1/3/4